MKTHLCHLKKMEFGRVEGLGPGHTHLTGRGDADIWWAGAPSWRSDRCPVASCTFGRPRSDPTGQLEHPGRAEGS